LTVARGLLQNKQAFTFRALPVVKP
jgi:hypothetical protein